MPSRSAILVCRLQSSYGYRLLYVRPRPRTFPGSGHVVGSRPAVQWSHVVSAGRWFHIDVALRGKRTTALEAHEIALSQVVLAFSLGLMRKIYLPVNFCTSKLSIMFEGNDGDSP